MASSGLFATNHSPESGAGTLRGSALLPRPWLLLRSDSDTRIFFSCADCVQFIDAHAFRRALGEEELRAHFVHPDAKRLIPFDTYNLFYRDDLETTRLAPLRQRALAIQ